MKNIIVCLALAFAVLGANASTSTSETEVDSTSIATVQGDTGNVSKAATYVFPGPVQPGMVRPTACTNSGVKSVALFFNLFSISYPEHVKDRACELENELLMYLKQCQFYTVAVIRHTELAKQYPGIKLPAPDPLVETDLPYPPDWLTARPGVAPALAELVA